MTSRTFRPSDHRLKTAREMVSKLIREPSFRNQLACQEGGERPVLIVSSGERVGSFFVRLEKVGLPVTVSLRSRKALQVIHVKSVESDDHEHPDDVFVVHPNITMSMMVDALWANDGSLLVHLGQRAEQAETDYEVAVGA